MTETQQRIRAVIPLPLTVLLTTALLVSSCVQVRLLTYPAEFNWLDSTSVKGTMREMATGMRKLDHLIDQVAGGQEAILNELSTIEAQAISLSSSTTGLSEDGMSRPVTNHLLIDENIDDFIEQIMRARLLAEADPPNYYGIGRLTGTCNACHRMR